MHRILPISEIAAFFCGEQKEQKYQRFLDKLDEERISWDSFLKEVDDLRLASRLTSLRTGRTLLHLAALNNRTDFIHQFGNDPILKTKADFYGLNPMEIAELLGRGDKAGLKFQTKGHLEQVLKITAKAKEDDEIHPEKIWLGVYFDKEISRGLHPPIAVKKVDAAIGEGVFAEKAITPCAFVGEYTGKVFEKKWAKGKRYCLDYSAWGKKLFTIDGEESGNFTRFINHSKTPNLGLQSVYWRGLPRMIFIALQEIKAGQQLIFDYGDKYWKELGETPKLIAQ